MSRPEFDVIIIGGGPGGLSAALWCADLGLRTAVFEREKEFGGQLLWTFNRIKNYLGIEAKDGRELCTRFRKSVENIDFTRFIGRAVTGFDPSRKLVTVSGNESYTAGSIIIATGVRRRTLNIPGEEEFAGRGILFSGVNSAEAVRGKRVVIVGGGDAALENALILSRTAEQVTIIHRGDTFRARHEFVRRIAKTQNIRSILQTAVIDIIGNESVQAVRIVAGNTSARRLEVSTDFVLVRIGVLPNTDICRGSVELDLDGYIIIDKACETSVTGVFAVGDVARPAVPTIAAAVGHGAIAAKSASNSLKEWSGPADNVPKI